MRTNIFIKIKNITLANPLLRSLTLLFTCVPPLSGIIYFIYLAAAIIWARILHADLEMAWLGIIGLLTFPAYFTAALIVAFVNQRVTGKYSASGLLILESILMQVFLVLIFLQRANIDNRQAQQQRVQTQTISKSIAASLSVTGFSLDAGPPLGSENDAWFGGEFRGGLYAVTMHVSLNVNQPGKYVVWVSASSAYNPQDFLIRQLGNTAPTRTARKFIWSLDLPTGPQIITQTIPFTDIDPKSPYNYLWLNGGKTSFEIDVFRVLTRQERLQYFGKTENSLRQKLALFHETLPNNQPPDLEPVSRGNYYVLPITLAEPIMAPGQPYSTPVSSH